MSGRGNLERRGGGRHRSSGHHGSHHQENKKEAFDWDNPVVKQFRAFASDLDRRHDKRERLVRLSRDITIESKRIIFLLHRFDLSQVEVDADTAQREASPANEKILEEAETRLKSMSKNLWSAVAKELQGEDPYFYLKAYTGGLQEFVEAISFHHHLKHGGLIGWDQVRGDLKFAQDRMTIEEGGKDCKVEETNRDDLEVMMPRSDFMLGIADLTGEVMRQAINSAGCGNTELCFVLLNFLQELHDGFVGLRRDSHREVPKKLHILQQSLRKVETVCYNINVRGTEVPKHLLGTYLELSGSNQPAPGDFELHDDQHYDPID